MRVTGSGRRAGRRTAAVAVAVTAAAQLVAAAPSGAATPAPKLTSLSVRSGPIRGGTLVTIHGTGFSHVSTVRFGRTAATGVKAMSSTSVRATAPAHSRGTVDVTVVTSHGTTAAHAADHFAYVAPPTISALSTTSGARTGGTRVTINGTNLVSVTSVTFGSATGTQLSVTSSTRLAVTTPPESTGTAAVTVTTAYGTATRSQAFTFRPVWSAPKTVDPPIGRPQQVTCGSDGTCFALDPYANILTTVNDGQNWKKLTPAASPGHGVTSLSCTSATFCAAVDDAGHALTYNGTTWTAHPIDSPFGQPLLTVSCASKTFCLALDDYGDYTTWTGTSWGPLLGYAGGPLGKGSPVPSPSYYPVTLSCGSSTWCAMVDTLGAAHYFTGAQAWSPPVGPDTVDPSGYITVLSCVVATAGDRSCVAGDDQGDVVRYAGGVWHTPHPLAQSPVAGVWCGADGFCAVVDQNDDESYFTGVTGPPLDSDGWTAGIPMGPGSKSFAVSCWSGGCLATDQGSASSFLDRTSSAPQWAKPQPIAFYGGLDAVSCVRNTTSCLATDAGVPVYVRRSGTSWSGPTMLEEELNTLTGVSCPTATACRAVDSVGNVVGQTTTGWQSEANLDQPLVAISCPTTTFCAAAGAKDVFVYSDGAWGAATGLTVADPDSLRAVSCASASFCVAVSVAGQAYTWSGAGWSDATAVNLIDETATGLSCPTSSFCVVSTSGGDIAHLDGTSWTLHNVDAENDVTAVSCASASFCVASDDRGQVTTSAGSTWSHPVSVDPAARPLTAVSCASSLSCVAVNTVGQAIAYS